MEGAGSGNRRRLTSPSCVVVWAIGNCSMSQKVAGLKIGHRKIKDSYMSEAYNPPDATFNGRGANQGLIDLGAPDHKEGYAVLKCGGTQVKISYTLLVNLSIHIDSASTHFRDMCSLSKAIDAITCEASLGNKGNL